MNWTNANYNLSQLQNTYSFPGIVKELNTLSGGSLGILLIMIMGIIITVALIKNGTEQSIAMTAGIISAIIPCIYLTLFGIIDISIAAPFILIGSMALILINWK